MPRPRSIATVLIVLALLLATARGRGASQLGPHALVQSQTQQLSVVSEDPYTNPGTYHRTQVEPVSAAYGSTIVSVFQSGRSANWGASNLGWSVSTDAGATWTDSFLPETTIHATPQGPWQRVTDPAIAYDAKHDTWLIVGIGTRACSFSLKCAGSQVFVTRSTDGARTFGAPIIPTRSGRTQFHDVPWIACDNAATSPFYGSCYTVWNDDAHRQLLNAYTSADGGLSWTKATIEPKQHCDGHPIPVVQPTGNVVVPLSTCGTKTRWTITSTDGGTTYAAAESDFPGFDGRAPAGRLRSSGIRRLDVDADGTIYAVWNDCAFRNLEDGLYCTHNDIALSTSQDGRHWTRMVRVPIDAATSSADHFLPAIAIDPGTSGHSAHIAIAYYFNPNQWCDEKTCELYLGLVSSRDGGSTWSVRRLAGPFRNTWFPLTDSGYMVGEYIGISVVDGMAIPVFPVASEGRCELGDVGSCNEWIASATVPL